MAGDRDLDMDVVWFLSKITAVTSALEALARTGYGRCRALVHRLTRPVMSSLVSCCCRVLLQALAAASDEDLSSSLPLQDGQSRQEAGSPRSEQEARRTRDMSWMAMVRAARGQTDYLVDAQVCEVTSPSTSPRRPSPPAHTARRRRSSTTAPPTGDSDYTAAVDDTTASTTTSLRRPTPRPPSFFSPADRAYLLARLPVRQPASAHTAVAHFRRLPFLYQDLAEGCRARLAVLPSHHDERERLRRRRMAVLAQRLAERYHAFRLVLPRSCIDEAIARWRPQQSRPSRFWEKVLDEVEKANGAWSLARLWILLFVAQSTLVACAISLVPPPARVALLVANALACAWSTLVMCEMLRACYVDVNAEEQELHDLLGGLRV